MAIENKYFSEMCQYVQKDLIQDCKPCTESELEGIVKHVQDCEECTTILKAQKRACEILKKNPVQREYTTQILNEVYESVTNILKKIPGYEE